MMYYYESFMNSFLIKKTHDDEFVFGPLSNESDTHFIVEMLNSGKLNFELGYGYAKKDSQEPNSVY